VKKLIIGIITLLLIGGGAAYYFKTRDNGVKFKTVPVSRGPLRASITATGTVNAVTTVLVGTQASGTIKKLNVDFNSEVSKGQIIAEIDPATFQAQVDQAQANILAARASVQKAKATLQDSLRTRDRNRQLYSRNLVARSELDTSEANYDVNEAQVAVSVAQVAQTEAALRFAETNLRYTKIVSPVDGIIVSRNVDVGQTVAASFQTPTLFTIAQDLTKMQIDTNVDEADIGRIQTDQTVEFTVDAYPDSTFHGRVAQIRIAPITVQNVVTYDVVIRVNNQELKLKPGMTANVSVIVAGKDDVLKVPNAALRFKPSEKEAAALKISLTQGPDRRPTGPVGNASKSMAGDMSRTPSREGKDGTQGPDRRPAGSVGHPSKPMGRDMGPAPSKEGKEGMRGGAPKAYAVWVLREGKPTRVPITIGMSDGAFTEVVSGDLKVGQGVVTESLAKTQKPSNGGPQSPPRFIR
jgi:HlyD family secretion protein